MKKRINYFLFSLTSIIVGMLVFAVLTHAEGLKIEPIKPISIVERPIGDNLVYSLLLVSSSSELKDIEKDLQLTELRGLDADLTAAEDVFRQ